MCQIVFSLGYYGIKKATKTNLQKYWIVKKLRTKGF